MKSIRPHHRGVAAFVFLLSTLAVTPVAQAWPRYYRQNCATSGCHLGTSVGGSPEDSPTCAGCHYHGMYTGRRHRTMNFRGWTDKTVYEAGESMTIYVTGGDRPGWARVRVIDENHNELARVTGPTGMGDDGDPDWTASVLPGPIVLRTRAPYLPGTYQWKVSWFGNTAHPNPAAILDHIYLKWHDVPLPPFEVYSNDKAGPQVSAVVISPPISGGVRHVTLTALASDAASGMTPLAEARYQVAGGEGTDTPGVWRVMDAADGAFDTADEQVRAAIDVSDLDVGLWHVMIRAEDALGNAGKFTSADFEVTSALPGDAMPPVVACDPPTAGPVPPGTPAILNSFIDDRPTGGSPIFDAEAFLDAPGPDGSGLSLTAEDGALDSASESMWIQVPTYGLADGSYPVLIHARDASGLWGPYCLTSFEVRLSSDTRGPSVVGASLSPGPTAGSDVAVLYVTVSDALAGGTGVMGAEWWVGAAPPPGSGTPLQAEDGAFDSSTEYLTGAISVAGWSRGAYDVGVRARDVAGNWGPDTHVSLQVTHEDPDTQGPLILWLAVNPDPTRGKKVVRLAGRIDESTRGGSSPVRVEYFHGRPGLVGSGTPVDLKGRSPKVGFRIPVDISNLLYGSTGAIYVRAMDEHGNWGPLAAVAFHVRED